MADKVSVSRPLLLRRSPRPGQLLISEACPSDPAPERSPGAAQGLHWWQGPHLVSSFVGLLFVHICVRADGEEGRKAGNGLKSTDCHN